MPGVTDLLHEALGDGRAFIGEIRDEAQQEAGRITLDQALAFYERIRRSPRDVETAARQLFLRAHPEVERIQDEDEREDVILDEVHRYQRTMETELRRRRDNG